MEGRRRTNVSWTRRFVEGIHELLRTPVRFALHLAVARLITQWRSLLTIVAGTILAASIGALVPLYTTAVSQVGMTQRLDEEDARDVHVQSNISLRASNWEPETPEGEPAPADAETGLQTIAYASTALVLDHVNDDLGVIEDWVDEVVSYVESEAMGISQIVPDAEEPVPLTGIRARVAYYEDWPDTVRVVDGRLPTDTPADDVDIEIAVGLNVANELNLETDMVIILDQSMNERGSTGRGHPSSVPITARIVGVVSPHDDEAAYWMEPSPLRLVYPGQWDWEFVFLTTEAATFRVATEFVPDTPTRIGWRVLFAHDNLPFSRIEEARGALRVFGKNMQETFTINEEQEVSLSTGRQDFGFNYHTRLIDYDIIRRDKDKGILLDYAKAQELLDAPFGLLLLQVGALVLFFLMVTAALVRRSERREIAMLQSRGAWDSQILLFRGIEAFLICALAVLIAPFLSRVLLTALGPTVANTEDFPLPLTANVFIFAALAAGVTFLALMSTLTPVLKLPLILAGGAASRSEKQLWWQKYYVDVILAAVGLGALWLMVRSGSPLSDVNLGGKQADPLMLMAPALLFLALGSIALRFFPILAGIAARISSAGNGLLNALATWQLSREPIHYGRITFLLSLAIGIGWFATSFRATVTNSHDDQAQYRVGTDIRVVERDTALNANRARTVEYYESLDEVAEASSTFRVLNANLSTAVTGDLRGTILAINPDTYGETLYWRSDLGSIYTPHEVSPALPTPGHTLPEVPAQIGLWARFEIARVFGGDDQLFQASVGRLVQRTELYIRFLDAAGAWVRVPVIPVEIEYQRVGSDGPGLDSRAFITSGWVYMIADLTALEYEPQGPLNLVSFYWTYRGTNSNGERGLRLTLADMSLFDAEGNATPYEFFADNDWEFAYDRGATATGTATPGWDLPGERDDSVYIRWDQDAQRTIIGILTNYPDMGVIDAVVSNRMQEENGLTWGGDAAPFTLLGIGHTNPQFVAVLVTDYYPSLYDTDPNEAEPKGDSFMVVDAHELLYRLNRRPSAAYYTDEVWLRMDESFDVRDEDAVDAFIEALGNGEGDESHVVILDEVTLAEELSKLRTDPLALGLLGLMYLAFIMALALSVVGLLTYAGLTAQARRTEFGVLRALGLSSLRVVGGLALEQTFVMIIGVILGALLGWVLASQVVPTLALGAAGEGITPPFVMRVETARLIEYALMMLVVLGLVLSSSLFLVRQLSLSRTLRLGEE